MSSKQVVTIQDGEGLSTLDAAGLMVKNKVGSVVVVNSAGNPIGIVTERDILRKVVGANKSASQISVKEIMSQPIITVKSYDSIETAAQIMAKNKIKRLVVLESNGKVTAVVSTTDIAKKLAKILVDEYNRFSSIKDSLLK